MKRARLLAACRHAAGIVVLGGLTTAVVCSVTATSAWAHAVCGNRVFPATLLIDDPGVGNELSLPTVQYTSNPASAGGGQQITYGYEWDKTITEHFGFAIDGDYVTQRNGGVGEHGWDNVSLTLKDQVICSEAHEFMASLGVIREFAKTGSSRLVTDGVIDAVSSTAPTLYVGKGLGDLPIGYLRPFGLTGEFSYQFSDSPNSSANQVNYQASLQYSIPYLQQHIKALPLPSFVSGMIPLVEVSMSTFTNGPVRAQTTGTIAPGLLYEANAWQVGIEVLLPANNYTRQSQGTGVLAQFHLFLDDIFPNSLGKPIF